MKPHEATFLDVSARFKSLAVAVLVAAAVVGTPAVVCAQFLTGQYTGDGAATQSIIDLGFSPDVVLVKGNTTQAAVMRTSSMSGDNTKDLGGTLALAANLIKTLDTNGFTVGSDARVNGNAVVYYWMAFKAVAGASKVSTYVGDGTSPHAITGVGFSPSCVIVMSASTHAANFKTTSMAGANSFELRVSGASTTRVTSLDADGFTLGTSTTANSSGVTYHYIALKTIAGQFNVGSFTGNGTDNRALTGVGFRPEFLLVKGAPSTTVEAVFKTASSDSAVDTTLSVINIANFSNGLQALGSDGFTVGTDNKVNTNTFTYYWVAFVRNNVTAVGLESFGATRYNAGTQLQWKTGYEVDNLGFRLYRETRGVRTRITPALIGGSGLQMSRRQGVAASGNTYSWWDRDADKIDGQVLYWLEDLDLHGGATLHGPFAPVDGVGPPPHDPQSGLLKAVPKPRNTETAAAKKSSAAASSDAAAKSSQSASVTFTSDGMTGSGPRAARDERRAVLVQRSLAARNAVKLSVRANGWYRVTQPELIGAGLPSDIDPRTLQLFAEGVEQPMKVTGSDRRFDSTSAIEFYGTGLDTPYTDARIFWLVAGDGLGKRIPLADGRRAGDASAASFPFTVERKDRTIFFGALQNGDAENFFGDLVTVEPTDETLTLLHLDPTQRALAQLEVTLQGVTELQLGPDHQVGVLVNGNEVGVIQFDGRERRVETFSVDSSLLHEGDNIVTLAARGGDEDVSLVDAIRLTYWRSYVADADQLRFTAQGQQSVKITGFSTLAIRVVDITDPGSPLEIYPETSGRSGAAVLSLRVPGVGPRTLLAFAAGDAASPSEIAPNVPSAWHRANGDYVLVSHRAFLGSLAPLVALRRGEGYKVVVVDVEDLYDEFNFGEKTPYALRDFLRSWRVPPRFVTLVGNATMDPRDYLGMGEPDFMPTKMVSTAVLETASDDWFADVDGDGAPDLAAVGRLPARTVEQAATMVAKIVSYARGDAAQLGTKSITLVADARGDNDYDFAAASRRLQQLIPADYEVDEIFRGELGTDAARASLFQHLNEGPAIVNYTGHASVQLWADNLFTNDDVPALTNGSNLPFFVLMNCLNGFFHSLFPEESLAESLIRAGNGGAVAVWASSGLTLPTQQAGLNRALFRLLLSGKARTLGEAAAAAKKETGDSDVSRTWIFFGDPATRLNGAPRTGAQSW